MKTLLANRTAHESTPPPRKNRLTDAVLTFLVVASAAFFVCAQASAIQIVSKTSNQVLIDATTEDVFVQTDVTFSKVEWSVDGIALPTDNVPDTTSQITYDFSTAPQGSILRFTATPYENDENGNEVAGDSVTIAITAAKSISSVKLGYLPSNVVVGEQFYLEATSDVPFHTIEWYFGGSMAPFESADSRFVGDRHAFVPYTFAAGQGSDAENGRELEITAVAYAINPSTDTQTWRGLVVASDNSPISVHEGKGKRLYYADADIYGFDVNKEENKCTVYWVHGFYYYNDHPGAVANMYAYMKLHQLRRDINGELEEEHDIGKDPEVLHHHINGKDGVDSGGENVLNPYWVELDLKYRGPLFQDFEASTTNLVEGEHYYAFAGTTVEENDDRDEIEWAKRRGIMLGIPTDSFETQDREWKDGWGDGWNSY